MGSTWSFWEEQGGQYVWSSDQGQRGNEVLIRQGPVAMVTALTFTLNELGNQWGFLQPLSDEI